ncbi:MAG: glycosyltransferase family 2 protein [Candidatus Thorarchaeota archaeon]|jgi:glycosyltransferase involved in cell wall biosynthesis
MVGDGIVALIRCRNEERWIGHAIQSVIDCIPEAKILVVDDRSTDESQVVVRQFCHTDISVLETDGLYTPGRALNDAIEWISMNLGSDYTLVMSAHCTLVKGTIVPVGSLKEHCVVWGKQIPVYRGKKINRRYIWSNFGDDDQVNYFSEIEKRYFIHNALALYRTETLRRFPFDENLQGKEDRYWATEMIDMERKTYYCPSMVCYHHWTPNGATWRGLA